MSALEMTLPYQRLKHEDGGGIDDYERAERLILKSRNWFRFRRVHVKKRFRVKVPSLRRVLRRRVKLVSGFRLSCLKVLKRLKESQAHFGDIFAGNYMFLQVNPGSLKSCQDLQFNLQGFSSRYPVPRIA